VKSKKTLFERLGGYDAIAAVSADLVGRLQKDPQLGRFWAHRGADGVKRELQLLIDYLCGNLKERGDALRTAPSVSGRLLIPARLIAAAVVAAPTAVQRLQAARQIH
jgi:truncated hemoglobin YjbI